MTDPSSAWISLQSSELRAAVDPQGAQLSLLRDSNDRDLLWNGDPSIWAGRAPVLFPIVGALANGVLRVNSKTYPLPRHGFARTKPFTVVSSTATDATFRLSADEATAQVYPFQFQLDVRFALAGATLSIRSSVRNLGREDMPASIGYHPGFRWPLPYGQPRDAHFIEFASDEGPSIRRLDGEGLLSPAQHPTPLRGRRLALNDSLFENDVIIWDDLHSRSVTYGAAFGPRIRVGYPDATYLGIWTKPHDAPFICIEPWQGIADVAGFTGELRDKLGTFTVKAGGVEELNMDITLLA